MHEEGGGLVLFEDFGSLTDEVYPTTSPEDFVCLGPVHEAEDAEDLLDRVQEFMRYLEA